VFQMISYYSEQFKDSDTQVMAPYFVNQGV